MVFLIGPRSDQQSYQKFRLLSCSGIHLTSFLNTSSPFLRPLHVGEQGSLVAFLELILCLVQYFNLRTHDQGALPSMCNLQLSLARRAMFLPFAVCRPRPPRFLGLVTFPHLTQCIFLVCSIDPKGNSY